MKKWLLAVLAAAILVLGACGGKDKDEKAEQKQVEVTLPAILFKNQDTDKALADLKADGVEDVTKNKDGSITLRMNETQHREWLAAAREEINESIDEIVEGGEHPSIKKIEPNNNFTEISLYVDRTAFEGSIDSLATITLGVSGMMYQLYSGIKEEDFHVSVKIIDNESGKLVQEILYPEVLENASKENKEDAK